MSLKKMMSAAAVVGAFGFTAIGLGAWGGASTVPSPVTPGTHGPDWNGPGCEFINGATVCGCDSTFTDGSTVLCRRGCEIISTNGSTICVRGRP